MGQQKHVKTCTKCVRAPKKTVPRRLPQSKGRSTGCKLLWKRIEWPLGSHAKNRCAPYSPSERHAIDKMQSSAPITKEKLCKSIRIAWIMLQINARTFSSHCEVDQHQLVKEPVTIPVWQLLTDLISYLAKDRIRGVVLSLRAWTDYLSWIRSIASALLASASHR